MGGWDDWIVMMMMMIMIVIVRIITAKYGMIDPHLLYSMLNGVCCMHVLLLIFCIRES